MKTIICKIDLFDLEQTLLLADSESNSTKELGKAHLSKLDSLIVNSCYALDVRKVHLFGPTQIAQNLNYEIQNTEDLCYECNKIEIEVN